MRSMTPNLQLPVAYLCGSVCFAPVPCDDAKAAPSPKPKVAALEDPQLLASIDPRQDGHKVAALEVPKRLFSDIAQKIPAQLLMPTG